MLDQAVYDFLFFLFYVGSVCTVIIYSHLVINLSKISIGSFFIWVFLCVDFIGIPLLYYGFFVPEYSVSINIKELSAQYLFLTTFSLLFFITGWMILPTKRVVGKLSFNIFEKKIGIIKLKEFVFAVLIISVSIYFISTIGFDNLALSIVLGISDGSDYGYKTARSLMGNNFGSGYYLIRVTLFLLNTYLLVVFYLKYFNDEDRKRAFHRILFILWLLFSLTVMMLDGSRSNLIFAIIVMYLAKSLSDSGHYKLIYGYVVLILLSLLVVVTTYYLIGYDAIDAILHTVKRILVGQIIPAIFYLFYYGNLHDYLYGASFPGSHFISGEETVSLGKDAWRYIHGVADGSMRVGSYNTNYIGEGYANFSTWGAISISFVLGFIYRAVDLVLRRNKTSYGIALYACSILFFGRIAFTKFSYLFVPLDFIILIVAYKVLSSNLIGSNSINTKKI